MKRPRCRLDHLLQCFCDVLFNVFVYSCDVRTTMFSTLSFSLSASVLWMDLILGDRSFDVSNGIVWWNDIACVHGDSICVMLSKVCMVFDTYNCSRIGCDGAAVVNAI